MDLEEAMVAEAGDKVEEDLIQEIQEDPCPVQNGLL